MLRSRYLLRYRHSSDRVLAVRISRHGFRSLSEEISRAKREAAARNVDIAFSVCDMRQAHQHHGSGFDLVISCDNSIPDLLSDDDILAALREMHVCLRPRGGCLITVRDYDREERGKRYLVFQVWDWEDQYDLAIYFVEEDRRSKAVQTYAMWSHYYAISPNTVLMLTEEADFAEAKRLDDIGEKRS